MDDVVKINIQLKNITDPRSYHGREYRHYDILYFTILAILSNAKTYADVATFIRVNFHELPLRGFVFRLFLSSVFELLHSLADREKKDSEHADVSTQTI